MPLNLDGSPHKHVVDGVLLKTSGQQRGRVLSLPSKCEGENDLGQLAAYKQQAVIPNIFFIIPFFLCLTILHILPYSLRASVCVLSSLFYDSHWK
jgi:hypothetical protein